MKAKKDSSLKTEGLLIAGPAIKQARSRIEKFLAPTPTVRSDFLSEFLEADVYLKLESLQPTHTFKVRGALNAISLLDEEVRARGVVTASGGNHGLGVAFAAKRLGLPATVYLPVKTQHIRVEAIEKLGARTVMLGQSFDDANQEAMKVAAENGLAYIHPFDNENVMAGQATIVLELLDQIEQPDTIVASIGGGGLISGIISAVKQYSGNTRVVGVETEGADCMNRSLEAKEIIELPQISSIADSLGARRTEERQYAIVSQYIDQSVVVDDKSTIKALLRLLQEEKVLMEPAAACSIAALLQKKIAVSPGQKVVVIVCGANIGIDKLLSWQQTYSIAFLT